MAIIRKDELGEGGNIQVGQTHTVIGPESSFDGKLTFQGAVRIDGKFSGEIVTDDVLVVGDGALVKAELRVGSLVLNGTIEGNVTAKNAIQIHAPGVLRGNMTTPSLTIDRGVIFEGSCHMDKSGQPPKTLTSQNDKAGKEPSADKAG